MLRNRCVFAGWVDGIDRHCHVWEVLHSGVFCDHLQLFGGAVSDGREKFCDGPGVDVREGVGGFCAFDNAPGLVRSEASFCSVRGDIDGQWFFDVLPAGDTGAADAADDRGWGKFRGRGHLLHRVHGEESHGKKKLPNPDGTNENGRGEQQVMTRAKKKKCLIFRRNTQYFLEAFRNKKKS